MKLGVHLPVWTYEQRRFPRTQEHTTTPLEEQLQLSLPDPRTLPWNRFSCLGSRIPTLIIVIGAANFAVRVKAPVKLVWNSFFPGVYPAPPPASPVRAAILAETDKRC